MALTKEQTMTPADIWRHTLCELIAHYDIDAQPDTERIWGEISLDEIATVHASSLENRVGIEHLGTVAALLRRAASERDGDLVAEITRVTGCGWAEDEVYWTDLKQVLEATADRLIARSK